MINISFLLQKPLKSKAILRNIFRTIVHDESAPVTAKEGDVDERLAHFLLNMDDPNIILDLRQLNGKALYFVLSMQLTLTKLDLPCMKSVIARLCSHSRIRVDEVVVLAT